MKTSMNPVRGCIDFMPAEAEKRQAAINIILRTYKDSGFLLIKTPILESLNLLCKGDDGENATKLMFKTVKRGEKLDLTKPNLTEKDIVEEGLRYDLTVPLARFYANNKADLPAPFKAIQIDEAFRAERPQKGRFRQFSQCDVDIFNESTILGEIELISTACAAYKALGLNDLVIKINSRKILQGLILYAGFNNEQGNDICIIIDKIDKIGLAGCKTELCDRGYESSKVDKLCCLLEKIREKGIAALKQSDIANEEIQKLEQLLKILKETIPDDFDVVFDIGIVRGQSYYTGFVFEVFQKNGSYKGAMGGGGRYDTMIEKMIDEPVPAVGFSIGLDTTLLVLSENGIVIGKERKKIALVYEKTDDLINIMTVKRKFMQEYEVSVLPQIKNQNEMERKLKLNNFDGIASIKNQQVRWF